MTLIVNKQTVHDVDVVAGMAQNIAFSVEMKNGVMTIVIASEKQLSSKKVGNTYTFTNIVPEEEEMRFDFG